MVLSLLSIMNWLTQTVFRRFWFFCRFLEKKMAESKKVQKMSSSDDFRNAFFPLETVKNFITNYLIFWIWSFIKVTWFVFVINMMNHGCRVKSVSVPCVEYHVHFQTLKNTVTDISLTNVNCVVMQLDFLIFWTNVLLLIRNPYR